ncbi:MAG: hypothetical protein JWN46_126 [Acidimicrobiales bacterium]|nr:hypothetical protein [Acidimicrobiales bacterium]
MKIAPSRTWHRPERAKQGTTADGEFRVTDIFRPEEDGLQAYVVKSYSDHAKVATHFHRVAQYQLFVEGSGTFQRHEVGAGDVHYTDAYSVYGPIVAGDQGLSFFVLRQHYDGEGHPMPGSRDELVGPPGRNISASGTGELIEGQPDGLAAAVLEAAPGAELASPDPGTTSGQYVVVLDGVATLGDEDLDPWSTLYVEPNDPAVRLTAGPEGCRVAVLAFPRGSDEQEAQ